MKNLAGGLLSGTDALGRPLPTEGVPAPRSNRQVGIFYFLWCGDTGSYAPFNISEIVAEDPLAGYKPEKWGKIGQYHHWGEPFYGYYFSSDEWVIRKHIKLLMQADIDFLFFDTTNANMYEEIAKKVLKVLQEYHDEGFKIPKVMFYTNTDSGSTVQKIYDTIYKPGYCPDTWFYFDGKPLIIAKIEECSEECAGFFTVRKSQWPNEADKLGGWPWMDFVRPQRVFKNESGADEVINVSVAQHPQIMFGDSVLYGETANRGRAFHNGENDRAVDAVLYGYNFGEQFERAIETDPPVVLVTGWNEWIAGRWEGSPERPIRFVDCCNCEYSRDIEMMRGGYFDNYFMLLAFYVRKYKGFAHIQTHCGDTAVYPNPSDGATHRDNDGYGRRYTDTTGRNAITEIAVAHRDGRICFSVKTKAEPAGLGEGDFLTLFIGCDKGRFAVAPDGIFRLSPDFSREKVADAVCEISGAGVTYSLPLDMLTDGRDFDITFKAADSRVRYSCVEDFYDKGDVAPLGRMEFLYRGNR